MKNSLTSSFLGGLGACYPENFPKNEALWMCFLNSGHKYDPVLNLHVKTTVFDGNFLTQNKKIETF